MRRGRLWFFGALLMAAAAGGQTYEADDDIFEVGYSASLFYDVDVNDARAATRVWLELFVRHVGEESTVQTSVLDGPEAIARAVERTEVDLVILSSVEYFQLRGRVPLVPLVTGSREGNISFEYGLLVRRGRGLQELADLEDRRLIIEIGGWGSIPWMWLDAALLRADLRSGAAFFAEVQEAKKVSQAVLPVFFGRADACVVSMESFATMVELNPQLGEALQVLRRSPPFCRGLVCAREDFNQIYGNLLEESLASLHDQPEGQQVLTLFHTDRLVPFAPAQLEGIEALMVEYEELRAQETRSLEE